MQVTGKLGAVLWVRVTHARHYVVVLLSYLVVGLLDCLLSEVVKVLNIFLELFRDHFAY